MLAENNIQKANLFNWLKLARSENIGPKTFHQLLNLYGTPSDALQALPELAKNGGLRRSIEICSDEKVEREIESTHKLGAQIIPFFAEQYPHMLRSISDAPAVITALGDINRLRTISLTAIVGSRDASLNGCNFAKKIAAELAANKIGVVSGLAKGIDTAAHIGSLEFFTAAIIAGGIDHIYPQENTKLFHAISESGLIITEAPVNVAPMARNFPQRNRIISALSKAVAVIEAAKSSGTLITAKYAKEQGKALFSVPGSPLDQRSGGTNMLIRQGAYLLESADDLVKYFKSLDSLPLCEGAPSNFNNTFPGILPTESEMSLYRKKLLQSLSNIPTDIESAIEYAGIPHIAASIIILELELAGRIERSYGNKITLIY